MNRIEIGDCRQILSRWAGEGVRVQTCITSPPYWGLRDYGVAGQLGLEPTPEEYVANMVGVFRLVREVLAEDGTLWINLGDSYAAGASNGSFGPNSSASPASRARLSDARIYARRPTLGLKPKDLVGIPWRVAFALQADGWYLRSDIIWSKPNAMPESVTDRPTKAHEYLFLLSKRERYYYNAKAIQEPSQTDPKENYPARARVTGRGQSDYPGAHQDKSGGYPMNGSGRNRRSVWTIATQPFSDWTETVRTVRVSADEADDDTMRIPSADCSVHEFSRRPHPIRVGDERANGSSTRRAGSDGRLAQAQASYCVPIGPLPAGKKPDENSGSLFLYDSQTANLRSTENHKTGVPSSLRDMPCEQTHSRTEYSEPSYAEPGPNGSDIPGSFETLDHIARTCACTCSYEKRIIESISHFATFPEALVEPCILAGSRPGDIVLDPFMGSGTVGRVATRLGRRWLGCELSPAYAELARDRTTVTQGLAL